MTSVPTSLGALIRRQREFAELPMRQLAAMSGISGPYLSQIENGLRAPSDQVLNNIATILGIDPEELLGESRNEDELKAARRRTQDAIQQDPNLTPSQKRTVLDVYAAMTSGGAAGGDPAGEADAGR